MGVLDAAFLFIVLIVTPVEKDVLLARVAMHVTVECDFALPVQVADHLFRVKNRFVQKLVRSEPLSV